uniref:Uncharacterized protein n=1 Tax=viral metagenome TaxID=1070528 RepID=A0A6C0HIH6_9ZZZZ
MFSRILKAIGLATRGRRTRGKKGKRKGKQTRKMRGG